MAGERDLDRLIASMDPAVRDGRFVFVTVEAIPAGVGADAVIREDEGITLVIAQSAADALGLRYDVVCGWITLRVHSALEAVGLTAAFSSALAAAGISANVLAGCFHDHLLVPIDDVDRAVAVLRDLSAARG